MTKSPETHSIIVLVHKLFETSEASGLPLETQESAARMLVELAQASKAGYTKVPIGEMVGNGAPNQSPSRQGK